MRDGIHGAPLSESEKTQKALYAVAALSAQGDELAAATLARSQHLLVEPVDLLAP